MSLDSAKIRVLIVDDHPVVRMGLAAALGNQPDMEVVGEARDIPEMLKVLEATAPDVVVLDLELGQAPEMEGLRNLRGARPDARVIIYTAHDDAECIVQSVELGVQGYLLKSANPAELVTAIQVVHNGGTLLQPAVATKLVQSMHRSHRANGEDSTLSARELEVLGLLAKGRSNCQIASALFISERTVKFHVSAILGKLNASNRTEAVLIATRTGVIEPTPGAG